jgi:DNA-binding transcriptional LysR family regulator
MNRNHLALFHAVAEAGNVTHAAERLHVSQPAVSKQVGELEEALGMHLLERLPRGIRLTEAGRLLADYARRLNMLEGEAARAIEEFRGLRRGRLAVGASTTIAAYLVPPVFGEFHKQFPDIELKLEIANTRDIQRCLVEGVIEAGLTEGVIEAEDLHSQVFHQDQLVAIAPAGHALLRKRRVTARELCQEPFILREEGSGTRAVVERALAARELVVTPVLSLASTEAIKHAVGAGLGVAIVSRLAIGLELKFGSLVEIPVKDLVIRRPLHLQRLRGRNQSPAMQRFLSLLAARKDFHAVGGQMPRTKLVCAPNGKPVGWKAELTKK